MRNILGALRPYGRVLPMRYTHPHLIAWWFGIKDGWAQPYSLGSSRNVDHLDHDGMVQESLDRGINLGQWLRSPLRHER